ncbi:hypothetical protein J7L01_04650 [bacterium]|nr:hypothetical protein [bacterium]
MVVSFALRISSARTPPTMEMDLYRGSSSDRCDKMPRAASYRTYRTTTRDINPSPSSVESEPTKSSRRTKRPPAITTP